MKYIVTLNDKDYEIEVERGEARVLSVTTAAPAAPVAAPAVAVAAAPSAAPAAAAVAPAAPVAVSADGEMVPAPMPGTIVSVAKNAGDTVKRGDVVLILEAMKMENEIVSPKDGIVAQMVVSRGANVSTGAPLFVVK